jgi:hypothetical protein
MKASHARAGAPGGAPPTCSKASGPDALEAASGRPGLGAHAWLGAVASSAFRGATRQTASGARRQVQRAGR